MILVTCQGPGSDHLLVFGAGLFPAALAGKVTAPADMQLAVLGPHLSEAVESLFPPGHLDANPTALRGPVRSLRRQLDGMDEVVGHACPLAQFGAAATPILQEFSVVGVRLKCLAQIGNRLLPLAAPGEETAAFSSQSGIIRPTLTCLVIAGFGFRELAKRGPFTGFCRFVRQQPKVKVSIAAGGKEVTAVRRHTQSCGARSAGKPKQLAARGHLPDDNLAALRSGN